MSIYKLAVGVGTAAGDGVGQLDIQFPGFIVVVQWAATGDMDAGDEQTAAEVSFLAVSSFGTNDARGSVSIVRARATAMTAEAGIHNLNLTVPGLRIPVSAGERMFLHTQGSLMAIDAFIHVDDSADSRLRRRR